MAPRTFPWPTADAPSSPESGPPPSDPQGAPAPSNPTQRADADAMARLARGEIGALGEIYDRHHAAVRRFLVRATGNTSDADDLVHSTFLTVPKIAGSFDPTRSCRAWLLGIAARMIQRHRTARGRWVRALFGLSQAESATASVDPEGQLVARNELAVLHRKLNKMSEAKRIVLIMTEVEGLAGDEIAAALEIPIGTVWRRLHDARRELMSVASAAGAQHT